MKAVIMAGGFGSRIVQVENRFPKPMIPVDGIPVLERTVRNLVDNGITDILMTVGYRYQAITDFFRDGSGSSPITKKPFCADISYFIENEPLGNAGALCHLHDVLTEDFLLINGDLVFDMDIDRMVRFHRENGGNVTLCVHPNAHPYDSQLIVTDKYNRVLRMVGKSEDRSGWYKNLVNAGIHILSPAVLKDVPQKKKIDLDTDIIRNEIQKGSVYAYPTTEYISDMGTPDRYEAVCKDVKNGIVTLKNRKNKQCAVFLDRDGTINKHKGFLKRTDEFELLPDVPEAINLLHKKGYLVIVVTNQPVVARGEASFLDVEEIHNKMETLLGEHGAYLDGLYYCPHHPDNGFKGERKELKIVCDCRKPEPGMILRAAEDYNIDLGNSWIIGDSEADIKAGENAGIHTCRIDEKSGIIVHARQIPSAVFPRK